MNSDMQKLPQNDTDEVFSGTLYLIYAFDIGDDVDLEKIRFSQKMHTISRDIPHYLKSYHRPLTVEVPTEGTKPLYANIHHFGAVSIVYQVSFKGTLTALRDKLNNANDEFKEQSVDDVHTLFRSIKKFITKPKFFHQSSSYSVVQITPDNKIDSAQLRKDYGYIIASALRFEKSNMSPFQVEDILESATGYYRNELVIIDTEAAFMYDKDPHELLDFFELALVQQLELRYFDKLLEQKLDELYYKAMKAPSLWSYLPFVGSNFDPISELSRLKVDISVIIERLENSIKTGGEAYYSEIYQLLFEKLELETWKKSVEKKLSIIRDVRTIYQNKINAIREDMLSVLIIILIFIELVVGIMK